MALVCDYIWYWTRQRKEGSYQVF